MRDEPQKPENLKKPHQPASPMSRYIPSVNGLGCRVEGCGFRDMV